VFAFGTAFHGSMGGQRLDEPVVGIAPDPAAGGYWLVASDGGVFAFDAPFLGSTGGSGLGSPVISLDSTTSGRGYRLVRVDGGVTRFGDARRTGDPSGSTPTASAVAEAEDPATGGYWLLSATGTVTACDGTWFGNS
jgi:hypothetical protein